MVVTESLQRADECLRFDDARLRGVERRRGAHVRLPCVNEPLVNDFKTGSRRWLRQVLSASRGHSRRRSRWRQ